MKVKFQLAQPLDIGNDGVELSLHKPDGAFVGKLTIGRATVRWRRRNARKDAEIKTEHLIMLIEEHLAGKAGRPAKSRRRKAGSAVPAPRSERHSPVGADA